MEIVKTTARGKENAGRLLDDESRKKASIDENIESDVSAIFMNAVQNYLLLKGSRPIFKVCVGKWLIGLIQRLSGTDTSEGVYDDPKGYLLREEIYQRLKYHFQFQIQLNIC